MPLIVAGLVFLTLVGGLGFLLRFLAGMVIAAGFLAVLFYAAALLSR